MKNLYIVRHCEALGQESDAPLTDEGLKQANALAAFFKDLRVEKIISSPYKRAVQTVEPLAKEMGIGIEVEDALKERILSVEAFSDWKDRLKMTFGDFDLKFKGGESSNEAKKRILGIIKKVINNEFENTIIVTHGNLMSLLLQHYNNSFGFEQSISLSNPDVYHIKITDHKVTQERIWNSDCINEIR